MSHDTYILLEVVAQPWCICCWSRIYCSHSFLHSGRGSKLLAPGWLPHHTEYLLLPLLPSPSASTVVMGHSRERGSFEASTNMNVVLKQWHRWASWKYVKTKELVLLWRCVRHLYRTTFKNVVFKEGLVSYHSQLGNREWLNLVVMSMRHQNWNIYVRSVHYCTLFGRAVLGTRMERNRCGFRDLVFDRKGHTEPSFTRASSKKKKRYALSTVHASRAVQYQVQYSTLLYQCAYLDLGCLWPKQRVVDGSTVHAKVSQSNNTPSIHFFVARNTSLHPQNFFLLHS